MQSKTKKTTLDEARAKADQEALDKETKDVAKKLEDIMVAHSFGLQPYIHTVVEAGVITRFEGRVRLMKMHKNEEQKQAGETK